MSDTKKKRRKPFPANNATKKFLEAAGYQVAVVEQTIPHCFIKRDFMNFADLIAIHRSESGCLAIQATAQSTVGGGNMATRRAKVLAEPRARLWVECGNRIWIVCWQMRGKGEQRRMEPCIEKLDIDHFVEAADARG